MRKEQPGFKSPRTSAGGSPSKFIDGIVASPIRQEENFSNIRIDTDGNIASVTFDDSYHAGANKTNWGQEAWQMVNSDDGWKINSVVFSIIVNTPPEKKEIAVAPASLAEYAGTYELKVGLSIVITVQGDRLMVDMNKTTFPLFAQSSSKFFEKTWGSTMEFIRDANGKVAHVVMAEGAESSIWVRR